MEGIKKLMEDLGVKDQKELLEYINDPAHQEEELVKQLKELMSFMSKNKN
ncbi:hypothetical protein [Fusobacterium necrophorum]|nr:hypothetical protein [Fusobacterium necrophorum]